MIYINIIMGMGSACTIFKSVLIVSHHEIKKAEDLYG